MRVRYLGSVTVAEPYGPVWEPGQEREVDPEHAERLLARPDFAGVSDEQDSAPEQEGEDADMDVPELTEEEETEEE